MYRFLNNKSKQLKLLPPTEDDFLLRLRRAALATTIKVPRSASSSSNRMKNMGRFWIMARAVRAPTIALHVIHRLSLPGIGEKNAAVRCILHIFTAAIAVTQTVTIN